MRKANDQSVRVRSSLTTGL